MKARRKETGLSVPVTWKRVGSVSTPVGTGGRSGVEMGSSGSEFRSGLIRGDEKWRRVEGEDGEAKDVEGVKRATMKRRRR